MHEKWVQTEIEYTTDCNYSVIFAFPIHEKVQSVINDLLWREINNFTLYVMKSAHLMKQVL